MSFIITGSNGRMGQSIIQLIKSDGDNFIAVNRESTLSQVSKDESSVMIDFSHPDFFNEALQWCVDHKKAFVSGTTGLTNEQMQGLEKASKSIPVLWAPNMSIGIAFMNKMLKSYKELANQFDFQIEEFHHNKKIDKPSGTGILLQNTLKETIGKDLPEVLSVRGGGIYGVHKVYAMSGDEVITLEHQAINREVFARGAINCAKWLKDKPAGLYKIEDLLS